MSVYIREYGSTLYVGMPMGKNGQKYRLQKTKSSFTQQKTQTKPQKPENNITTTHSSAWHKQKLPYYLQNW